MTIDIRRASARDAKLILNFIIELARYENAEDEVIATEDTIKNSIFSEASTTHALICEVDGVSAGFAVYFFNYSTWLGRRGIYLEDLYVSPNFRGVGAGKALLQHLAKIAVDNDCGRLDWSVLDWNKPAIEFYRSIGAKPLQEWVGYRLERESLDKLACS